tara:strand:- start:101 stop:559 length:459 start_codon:yes stop_codon:yes gene_type:complete
MKKLLAIVVLGLLWSGNSYAESINLKCTHPDLDIPLSVVIDTKNKKVSYQGSNFDDYYLENGVFYFVMQSKKVDYRYAYSLNRNTGVLKVSEYKFSEEEMKKKFEEVAAEMILSGKSTKDKSWLVKLIIDKYNEGEPTDSLYVQCEKNKVKF